LKLSQNGNNATDDMRQTTSTVCQDSFLIRIRRTCKFLA